MALHRTKPDDGAGGRHFRQAHLEFQTGVQARRSRRFRLRLGLQQVALGRVTVDVAPLRANAGDPTATWVARALAWALTRAGRAGAPISVRIDYVILGPSSGGVGLCPGPNDRQSDRWRLRA